MGSSELTAKRFESFLFSFGVVTLLRDRAWASAAFIEYILLSFSQIDASLRMGLVLKGQLDRQDNVIDGRVITNNIGERKIFERAQAIGVIDEAMALELHRLYDFRNAVVHRMMITDIDYEAAKRLASQLEPVIAQLTDVLRNLEDEQMARGVGMTQRGHAEEGNDGRLQDKLAEHIAAKLGDSLENLDRVRPHKWPDVEDIVDFAVRKGLIEGPPDPGE